MGWGREMLRLALGLLFWTLKRIHVLEVDGSVLETSGLGGSGM